MHLNIFSGLMKERTEVFPAHISRFKMRFHQFWSQVHQTQQNLKVGFDSYMLYLLKPLPCQPIVDLHQCCLRILHREHNSMVQFFMDLLELLSSIIILDQVLEIHQPVRLGTLFAVLVCTIHIEYMTFFVSGFSL